MKDRTNEEGIDPATDKPTENARRRGELECRDGGKHEAPHLSQWVRRRVRLYYWKQWKQPRTRRRNLLALGADPATVHMATRSRKGYWRMSQNEYRGAGWTGANATCPGRGASREAASIKWCDSR